MNCPACKKPLDKAIFYEVEVDYCSNCLGFWFEEEELRWTKDAADRNLNWLDIDLWKKEEEFKISRDKKLCPSCRLPLYEVNYGNSNIKVDVCNLCRGIWLDRGEFKKIIKYLKERRDSKILDNYIANLIREFWEILAGPESLKEEIFDFLTILKVLNYKFATQKPTITKIILSLPK